MPKIATLRAAHSYIWMLSSMLAELESRQNNGMRIAEDSQLNIFSYRGRITHQQHNACFGGNYQQPEIAADKVIGDQRATLTNYSVSQQMSPVDQRAVGLCLHSSYSGELSYSRILKHRVTTFRAKSKSSN